MAIIASAKSNFEPISEGVHTAVCINIIDLGEQYSPFYKNNSRKVMITWETPDETITRDGEEKPMIISKEYTLSLSDKASLRKDLAAWRGRDFTDQELAGFDLKNVLGKACQIQIMHNEKGYAKIASIMSLPKGMPSMQPAAETIYFDLSDPDFLSKMGTLPMWIQDKIKESKTYKERINANVDAENGDFQQIGDSDLPF